jgi:hypothetical protein
VGMPSYSVPSIILGIGLALPGCTADGASTSQTKGPCIAEAAQKLVGKPKPTDQEAMQMTNSKSVRQIQPGDMVTHDLREDRVTIETDHASGLVVAARCG